MTPQDASLWKQWCERRDSGAFEALVAAYAPFVYDFARRVTGQDADAEDLAQEAFLDLATAPADRPSRVGLRAFLGRRVVLGSKTLRRVTRSRRRRDRAAARPDVAAAPAPARSDAEAALDLLNEEQRAAATLRFLHGLSYAEVAECLGLSEAAARMRVHRALLKLRSRLGSEAQASIAALALFRPRAELPAAITKAALVPSAGFAGLIGNKLVIGIVLLVCMAGTFVLLNQGGTGALPRAANHERDSLALLADRDEVAQSDPGPPPASDADGSVAAARPRDESTETADDEQPAGSAAFMGRVRFADGEPARGLELVFKRDASKPVTTDEEGRFLLDFGTWQNMGTRSLGIRDGRGWIALTDVTWRGGVIPGPDVRLIPGVEIVGRVVARDSGIPLADQRVLLRRRGLYERGPAQAQEGWAFTDTDGGFRFRHVPPGQYNLSVDAAGFEPWTKLVDVAADAPLAEILLLRQRDLLVRFANLPAAWKRAYVYIYVYNFEGKQTYSRAYFPSIGENGEVTIPAPPHGSYNLRLVHATGFPLPEMSVKLEVGPDPPAPVVFSLPEGARLTGRLLRANGTPLARAHLQLEESEVSTVTDDEGRFVFPGAPAGANRVRHDSGFAFVYVADVEIPNAGDVHQDIRLRGEASVSGTVSAAHDPRFVRLELLRGDEVVGAGLVSPMVGFSFTHLEPGSYRLRMRANDAVPREVEIRLKSGEKRNLGSVVLESYAQVPIRIKAPRGTVLPPMVYAKTTLAGQPRSLSIALSGTGDGTLSGLPAGVYAVTLELDGYRKISFHVRIPRTEKGPILLELVPD